MVECRQEGIVWLPLRLTCRKTDKSNWYCLAYPYHLLTSGAKPIRLIPVVVNLPSPSPTYMHTHRRILPCYSGWRLSLEQGWHLWRLFNRSLAARSTHVNSSACAKTHWLAANCPWISPDRLGPLRVIHHVTHGLDYWYVICSRTYIICQSCISGSRLSLVNSNAQSGLPY